MSPLRTTPPNPSFCGNPSLCDEDDYFRANISDEDKDDSFRSYPHHKDDFVRGNDYDEEKGDCLTFFEVCFPLTDLRFLCMVLLFLLLFIVCD